MIYPEFILKEQLDSIAVKGEILLDHELLNLLFLAALLVFKLVKMLVLELENFENPLLSLEGDLRITVFAQSIEVGLVVGELVDGGEILVQSPHTSLESFPVRKDDMLEILRREQKLNGLSHRLFHLRSNLLLGV